MARADARITLALNGATRVRVDGTLAPAPGLLPPPVARLLGERVQLALSAVRAGPDQLAIEELRATAARATLTGSGRIDLADERVTARASLEIDELAPLGELVAMPLDGSLQVTADVDGPVMQPTGRIALTTTALVAGATSAREVRTTFDLSVLQRLSEPGARVQVALEGRAQGLRLPPEVPLAPQDVVWQGRLTAPVDGAGTVTVERLTMRADHLSLTAQGMLDATTLGGEAQVALAVDRLAAFAERYGQAVEGSAELQASLAVGAGAEVISIDLYGGAHELGGLPEGLGELLGPALTLEANAIVVPHDSVELTHVRVEAAAATLDGKLELGLPEQTLAGAVSVDLRTLAPLSPLLGFAVDGPLSARARLGGAMARPAIELAAQSPGLVIAGEHVDALTLTATADGTPEAADGRLRLAATARNVEAELAAAVELRRPKLRLSDVSLSAPRTRASGNLSFDLERRLIEGDLTGRIEQLREFAGLLPARLAGALQFEAHASAKDGAQTIDLTARGRDLAGDFGRVQPVRAAGRRRRRPECPPRDRRPDHAGLRAGWDGAHRGQRPSRGDTGGPERQGCSDRASPRALRPRCARPRRARRSHAGAHRTAQRAPVRSAAASGQPGHPHPGRPRRRARRSEPAPRRDARRRRIQSRATGGRARRHAGAAAVDLARAPRCAGSRRSARRPPQPARGGGQSERQHPARRHQRGRAFARVR